MEKYVYCYNRFDFPWNSTLLIYNNNLGLSWNYVTASLGSVMEQQTKTRNRISQISLYTHRSEDKQMFTSQSIDNTHRLYCKKLT